MKLLHIEASPRGDLSTSNMLGREIVERARLAGAEIDRLSVWEETLPQFDGAALSAKYTRLAGGEHDEEQRRAWAEIEEMVRRLDSADHVLIATPMWNFGIPYRLKHWFDLITQPGLSFTFDPSRGYSPLLSPRPVTIVLASAGDYSRGPSWGRPDLASGYLEAALGFIGLRNPRIVRVGPTSGPMEAHIEGLEKARRELDAITFGSVEA